MTTCCRTDDEAWCHADNVSTKRTRLRGALVLQWRLIRKMTLIDPEVVADWCARHPLALPVLYRRHIDASDPVRTLAACCEELGAEVEPLIAEVAASERALVAPWQARMPAELIDHVIRAYHRRFEPEVDALDAAIAAVPAPAGERADAARRALRDLVAELRDDMVQHMMKEERVLFPWLRERPCTAAVPIRAMQLEHADTLGLLHDLKATGRRWQSADAGGHGTTGVTRALDLVVDRLCEHIHLESNELFPRALDAAGPPR